MPLPGRTSCDKSQRWESADESAHSKFHLDPTREFGKNSVGERRWFGNYQDRPQTCRRDLRRPSLRPVSLLLMQTRGTLSVQNVPRKKEWMLTGPAFRQLLVWLDDGTNSSGQSYLDLRQRLVAYFDRKNCRAPDDLADETLNRVARRLEEEGTIVTETPARYCYIVARFVFHEYLRGGTAEVPLETVSSETSTNDPATSGTDDEGKRREHLLSCLDQCTEKLDPAHRDLIIRYYHGEQRVKIQNRVTLAQELGITINALSIRACRIRGKLEACVRDCAGRNETFSARVSNLSGMEVDHISR